MLSSEQLSNQIKAHAKVLGFSDCGIAKADALIQESHHLSTWLSNNDHAEMHYMENHFEKRTDPRKLVEGAKSVVSVLLNYYPENILNNSDYKISKYAYGLDYHYLIKDKLNALKEYIEQQVGPTNSRIFVDSAPVMDKVWAQKSGLGWIGKNTCLISKKKGSFFFIGELILDLELKYDKEEFNEYCGNCTKCIEACPTEALKAPYKLDANKCISFLTIENKGAIPEEFKGKMNQWIFGCDICQDVCPHNKFSIATTVKEFKPSKELSSMKNKDWLQLDKPTFKRIFKNTCLERTKFEGLKRNLDFTRE